MAAVGVEEETVVVMAEAVEEEADPHPFLQAVVELVTVVAVVAAVGLAAPNP